MATQPTSTSVTLKTRLATRAGNVLASAGTYPVIWELMTLYGPSGPYEDWVPLLVNPRGDGINVGFTPRKTDRFSGDGPAVVQRQRKPIPAEKVADFMKVYEAFNER